MDTASRVVPLLGGYAGTISFAFPHNLPAIMVFAIATVSLLGSWFHDSVHRSVRLPAGVDFLLARLGASPVGFSPRWWAYKHVRLHHRYPGNPEFDPDIQFGRLGRVSSAQGWQPLHLTQHVHMWFLLPFSTLNMLKPAEPRLVRRYNHLPGITITVPGWVFLLDKYVGALVVWLPVFLTQSLRGATATFLVFHLCAGTLVSFVTQVQHNTALSDDSDDYSARWPLCDQVLRTTDVGRRQGVWWWLCGGVNFHIAHHLAPSLTFLELPAVTARLRADLREIGLDLPVHRDMITAVRSHASLVRSLARRPCDNSPHSPGHPAR
ncbi:fatty acid desaturase [Plantactinospora sp. B24E8]|uniref:fatty acid desaturase family protein n=1 Tax=Plantactinospora sp. B24E8 TaxID=3153567 RepID=UPI00325DEE79